jgi:MPBQ/MSBQ methyltransferase
MIPAYLDAAVAAQRAGRFTPFIHLGLWAAPPTPAELAAPQAFARAQERLNRVLLQMARLADGQCVVDVGCGVGGTLGTIAAAHQRMRLLGVNLDARQLALAAAAWRAPAHSQLTWLQADGLALPLASASVDRLLCIEAMFHFASRAGFLAEAARVLKPGGLLVCSDLVMRAPFDAAAAGDAALREALLAGFGPWPELDHAPVDHAALAAPAGLRLLQHHDATLATLPSHHFTVAPAAPGHDPVAAAVRALARLHRDGRLAYPLLLFQRD